MSQAIYVTIVKKRQLRLTKQVSDVTFCEFIAKEGRMRDKYLL